MSKFDLKIIPQNVKIQIKMFFEISRIRILRSSLLQPLSASGRLHLFPVSPAVLPPSSTRIFSSSTKFKAKTAMDHLFEDIVAGKIPSLKIYEDEFVYSFLDINPLAPGHTLVIPKKKYVKLHEVPEEEAAAIGRVLPRIARAVVAATGCEDYNILQNNGRSAHQEVPHVHFHIIPKPSQENGLKVGWPSEKIQNGEEMKDRIIAQL